MTREEMLAGLRNLADRLEAHGWRVDALLRAAITALEAAPSESAMERARRILDEPMVLTPTGPMDPVERLAREFDQHVAPFAASHDAIPELQTEVERLRVELEQAQGQSSLNAAERDEARQVLHALRVEVEQFKTRNRELENALVEANSLLESIGYILNGEEVSDFMESYPIVRQVLDLVDARKQISEECLKLMKIVETARRIPFYPKSLAKAFKEYDEGK